MYNKPMQATYINGNEAKTAFENIGKQVETIFDATREGLKFEECRICGKAAEVKDDAGGKLCSEHSEE